ncbi:MAG: hypothetical protein QW597_01650 [Thermoplasmataceae archaeon]
MTGETPPDFWNATLARVLMAGSLTIQKVDSFGNKVPDPFSSGLFRRSIGEPKGQIADWRASIEGSERGVHVVEFRDRYELHVDRYDPYKNPLKHIVYDSPKTGLSLVLGGIGIALFIRSVVRRR